ncbi:MAG: hypothetical protein GY811_03800 [Myxococcales bacterium]|nr:hypothetical protein [Myxococcales bacterium]
MKTRSVLGSTERVAIAGYSLEGNAARNWANLTVAHQDSAPRRSLRG